MGKVRYPTSKHYTLYWKLEDRERHDLNQYRDTKYIANPHLRDVKAGDTLWIVNVYRGRLFLIGRLRVAGVTSDTQQAQELVNTDTAWVESDYYALADQRDVEPLRELDITDLVEQITYVDMPKPLKPYPVDAMQFRALRELTNATATLFNRVWADTEANTLDTFLDDEDIRTYSEGRVVKRTLTQRERNRQLVEDAKARAQRKYGAWVCEVCGFNFEEVYGIPYIEAHHAQQMASLEGEVTNTLDDLQLLCANCHRMVHTQTPPLTIEALKARLNRDDRKR